VAVAVLYISKRTQVILIHLGFINLVMGWVVLWTKKIVYHSHELTYKPARVDSFNK
jgi:hypothetical protein